MCLHSKEEIVIVRPTMQIAFKLGLIVSLLIWTSSCAVNPVTGRIRVAGSSDNLENLLRPYGVQNGRLAETAALNGRFLSDSIPSNTMLKVIERRR